jgi:hypothetical protein
MKGTGQLSMSALDRWKVDVEVRRNAQCRKWIHSERCTRRQPNGAATPSRILARSGTVTL